jgi:hypothetical protein
MQIEFSSSMQKYKALDTEDFTDSGQCCRFREYIVLQRERLGAAAGRLRSTAAVSKSLHPGGGPFFGFLNLPGKKVNCEL